MDTRAFDDIDEIQLILVRGDSVRTVPEAGSLSIRTVEALNDAGWYLRQAYPDNFFTRT
jgi:hypothetical protein